MSISPKLASSTPDDPVWAPRHAERRIDRVALRALMGRAEYQLKLVVTDASDLAEIEALVRQLSVAEPWRVLLMPEARTVAELDALQRWLADVCKDRGYRYCDRLHLRLWGNTPGT